MSTAAEEERASTDLAAIGVVTTDLLSEQVYQQLRRAILHRDLAPGTRLVETEIARQYKISQAPVRDAIRRLGHEGLTTYVKRRGSYVTETSAKESEYARQVRVVLEDLAARLCAGKLSEEHEVALRREVVNMHAAAAERDPVRSREADLAFHRTVCEASGNPDRPKTWAVLESTLYRLFAIADPFAEVDLTVVAEMHEELLTALLTSSPTDASALFVAHASGSHRLAGICNT